MVIHMDRIDVLEKYLYFVFMSGAAMGFVWLTKQSLYAVLGIWIAISLIVFLWGLFRNAKY